jgi:hypothetical protein
MAKAYLGAQIQKIRWRRRYTRITGDCRRC